ncbi:hypothetical protein BIW11_04397, partial [Tropilaelaps mercedesae]
DERC